MNVTAWSSACPAAVVLIASLLAAPALGQERFMDAGTLAHALDRLTNTGRVLYIAAHPDDENTRLLAHLANERHVTAAYLSMTRGGGGQNLIGSEQAELLDVIRTEELLAARRLDGALQRFTRMRDFGYSKTAEETLRIWGHEEALGDVVWVIRTFQPDVIIARFDERPPNHGHHTASAILAREAFAAAADPERFPEQIARGAGPWQPNRLLYNLSTWREEPIPPDAIPADVGGYDSRLGMSYGELAALSRSQHKSQGFGVPGERGSIVERFVFLAGARPDGDILGGLDVSWKRFGEDGASFAQALDAARQTLDRDQPERALPKLLKAHRGLDDLPDTPRVRDARAGLNEIIASASGLFARASAPQPGAVPGSELAARVELVLRRPASIRLKRIRFAAGQPSARTPIALVEDDAPLVLNTRKEISQKVQIPSDAAVSAPYWLAQPSLPGRQVLSEPALVGEPEGPPALAVEIDLEVEGRAIQLIRPVVYTWTDRVHGERLRKFLIVPPATITPLRDAVLFPNGKPAVVALRVRAGKDHVSGAVSLSLPADWQSEPAQIPVTLARTGDETTVQFQVKPPKGANALEIEPSIELDGTRWAYREDVIDHAHIPMQVVLQPVTLRLVPLSLQLPKGPVGYIEGPGDTVAQDLQHVGLTVEILDDQTIRSGDLDRYRAIVVGIRAYNTRAALRAAHQRLMSYAEGGGILLVQYVTNNRWDPIDVPLGPFPFAIGRDRVTDETAEMVAVTPDHPLLRKPNRIDRADFDGWVQERGLYYAESWDERYEPIFRTADPNEEPLLGGLLVARHGRGRYAYTGLAFFRQLPAGVPGAYRLLANLIAGADR